MPQSGPEAPMPGEKEADADSSSTSSGGSPARAEITVIRTQPPVTPARQRSSESNRTEPSEDKKGKTNTNIKHLFVQRIKSVILKLAKF